MSVSFSYSKVQTFQSCAKKYKLSYLDRMQRVGSDNGPASFGSMFHAGIAGALKCYALYLQDNPPLDNDMDVMLADAAEAINSYADQNEPNERFTYDPDLGLISDPLYAQEWLAQRDDAIRLVRRTLENLNIRAYRVATVDSVPIVEYEVKHELPVQGAPHFTGVVDALMYNLETGHYELFDWKTKAAFNEYDQEFLNSQLALYAFALGVKFQLSINFTVLYQIKSTLPKKPSLNKADKHGVQAMSRQAITSDWATYSAALIEAGLDPNDYLDMQEKFSTVEFFRPIKVHRNARSLGMIWRNFLTHATRITSETLFPAAYSSYVCRGCSFAQWCNHELRDLPTDELIGPVYELKAENLPLPDDPE